MATHKLSIGVLFVIALFIFGTHAFTQKFASTVTLRIGALAPLSGQLAVVGERMRNGLELARQDLVTEGVVENIDMIYEDACDSKSSLDATRKLVDSDKVSMIASSFCLVGLEATIPLLERHDVLTFNTAANTDATLNRPIVFSTNIPIKSDATVMAEYAYSVLDAKHAAMIHWNTSFGENYRDHFSSAFRKQGGAMKLTLAAGLSQQDFRTELTKIKAVQPDVLVIIHAGSSLGNAIKQARELGITAPIMGDHESEDPTVLEFAGAAAEGLIISSSQPQEKTAAVRAFEEKYFATYGELPDVLTTNAYDALQLQVRAYVACGNQEVPQGTLSASGIHLDTQCIAAQLKKTTNYEGVSGTITIDSEDHSVQKPTIFKIVRNGTFVPLENN